MMKKKIIASLLLFVGVSFGASQFVHAYYSTLHMVYFERTIPAHMGVVETDIVYKNDSDYLM